MRLQAQLDALRERIRTADPTGAEVLNRAIERLRMLQLAENGPDVGEPFPDFEAVDETGSRTSSQVLLASAPLVLVVFRGDWCPYCDLTLRAMNGAHPALREAGATLVAIAPEPWSRLREIATKRGLTFPVLSDPKGELGRRCGLEFEMTDEHVRLHGTFAVDVRDHHDRGEWVLPVASTFLIDEHATIRWRFVDVDWTVRAEPHEVLAAIRSLKQPSSPAGSAD